MPSTRSERSRGGRDIGVPYHSLHDRFVAQARQAQAYPALFGSARTGAGVDELIAALAELLPAREGSGDAPLAATVFKIERGNAGEKVAYVYVRAGTLRVRDRVASSAESDQKVTAIHKSNIMKFSDGLFLATARKVAESYPDIAFQDVIVDNMCMQLVQKPKNFDVLVLPNLYGDILSDLCAGLVGGLGVAPGMNLGDGGIAIFEATHGSAPKYKGKNKVNPTALLLSGMLMLRHLGEAKAADRLERAIARVIAEGKSVTYDLKADRDDPTAVGTREMGQAIIEAMGRVPARR